MRTRHVLLGLLIVWALAAGLSMGIRAVTASGSTEPGWPDPPGDAGVPSAPLERETRSPRLKADRVTISAGGNHALSTPTHSVGITVGQPVAGEMATSQHRIGLGFWYAVTEQGAFVCPIAITGDVNVTGGITMADIIYMVNYILKAGPGPFPCEAASDVNCDGSVVTSDIIYLVNFALKAGPVPCDGCTSALASECS
jgi:hypothetical protein